jgi:hypothetical protein
VRRDRLRTNNNNIPIKIFITCLLELLEGILPPKFALGQGGDEPIPTQYFLID